MDEAKPVRAWMKWDEREGYAYCVDDWPFSQIGEWKCITIPLGATGTVLDLWSIDSLVEVIELSAEFGPLRSLRILFSNGSEIEIYPDPQSADYWIDTRNPRPNGWLWNVGIKGGERAERRQITPTSDSDAVEQALSEARNYFASSVSAAE